MPKEHLEDSSSKLCPPCQTVRGTIFASKKKVRLDLHKNYKELSSCKACPLCQFVCRELLYVIDAGVGFKWHDASSFAADQAIAAEVGYTTMVFKHGEVYSTLKIHVGGQKTLEYDKLVIDLDTADREKTFTRPADRFKWAKKWIDRCVEKHSDCGGAMSGSFNPTRLLDVLGDTEESDIRLVLSKNIKGSDHKEGWNDKYMTLSYCWGAPGKNLITTDDNIKERQQTISLNDLPKTVRDAVILTRRMKVRYLWVDALCIVSEGHRGHIPLNLATA